MVERATGRRDAVVVPGIDAPSSVACLRSLGRRDVRTVVVSEDEGTPAAYSRYCDEVFLAPDPSEDLAGYGDVLLELASRPAVRTVIPVREPDVYILADRREAFAEHVATPWPTDDRLETVRDRWRLFDVAESVDVGVPETTLLTDWDDWNRPAIVKSRYTVQVTDNRASYPPVRYVAPGSPPDVASIVEDTGHEPLAQEYMPDPDEYAYFALFDRGTPVATFQHRQVRGYKYSGGPSAFREAVEIPEVGAAGRRLLEALEWHGLAMVEFKRHEGDFKLMEVNPRFWSSLPFSVRAGVDFPYHYYRMARGDPIEADGGYDVGTGGHLIRGEIGYLYSLFGHESPLAERPGVVDATRTVAGSFFRHPRFDYLRLDDPVPFVQDLRRNLGPGITQWL